MASLIAILDLKGKPLIQRSYRDDVPPSYIERFLPLILEFEEEETPVTPCFTHQGINYLHIRHSNLYLLALSKGNSNAAEIILFLQRLCSVLVEYFKELEEESIRDNFVIIYELLDEVMDFGYPQTTESKILQEYITQESHKLDAVTAPPASVFGGSFGGGFGGTKSAVFGGSGTLGGPAFGSSGPTTNVFASAPSGAPNVFATLSQPAAVPIVPLGAKVKPFGAPDTDEEKSDDEDDDKDNGDTDDATSTTAADAKAVGLGEDNEDIIYQIHTKLYKFDSEKKKWAERGMGGLKLLVEKEDYDNEDDDSTKTRKARLVMRQVGVGRVILNVALFSSMNLQQDDRVVRFLVPELNEEGETSTIIHLVRLTTSDNAKALVNAIEEYLPSKTV